MRTAVTRVRLQNLGSDEVSLAFCGKAFEEAVEVVVLLLKGDHLGAHVIGGAIKVLRGVEAGVQEPPKAEDVDVEVLAGHYGVVNGAETAKPRPQRKPRLPDSLSPDPRSPNAEPDRTPEFVLIQTRFRQLL